MEEFVHDGGGVVLASQERHDVAYVKFYISNIMGGDWLCKEVVGFGRFTGIYRLLRPFRFT
jgi:hypothetical protein